jgi:hypothetical protein
MCTDKSINLLEYPYSLSYQDIILKKVEFNPIPALASIIEVLESETNPETLLNLQYILKRLSW